MTKVIIMARVLWITLLFLSIVIVTVVLILILVVVSETFLAHVPLGVEAEEEPGDPLDNALAALVDEQHVVEVGGVAPAQVHDVPLLQHGARLVVEVDQDACSLVSH